MLTQHCTLHEVNHIYLIIILLDIHLELLKHKEQQTSQLVLQTMMQLDQMDKYYLLFHMMHQMNTTIIVLHMHLQCLVLLKLFLNHQVLKVPKVSKVLTVFKEIKEIKVSKVKPVLKVIKVIKVFKVKLVLKVIKVIKVKLVLKVIKVIKVKLVLKVIKEIRV